MDNRSSTALIQEKLQPSARDLQEKHKLIVEREKDIEKIATDVQQLHQAFNELGTLVVQQGELINNIEENINLSHQRTQQGVAEIKKARKEQEKNPCPIL